jgi:hypothetical protein
MGMMILYIIMVTPFRKDNDEYKVGEPEVKYGWLISFSGVHVLQGKER